MLEVVTVVAAGMGMCRAVGTEEEGKRGRSTERETFFEVLEVRDVRVQPTQCQGLFAMLYYLQVTV